MDASRQRWLRAARSDSPEGPLVCTLSRQHRSHDGAGPEIYSVGRDFWKGILDQEIRGKHWFSPSFNDVATLIERYQMPAGRASNFADFATLYQDCFRLPIPLNPFPLDVPYVGGEPLFYVHVRSLI